ncbi:hypothetical protein [Bradyrhizobium sp. BR 1433]|uniref:hypothetical protein n=1 Tax=Bradyrhizobium sp. BR 1433 TaxID=3447967 RepID=UPI003EE67760
MWVIESLNGGYLRHGQMWKQIELLAEPCRTGGGPESGLPRSIKDDTRELLHFAQPKRLTCIGLRAMVDLIALVVDRSTATGD